MSYDANAALIFGTSVLERVRITKDGNVGIGTATPGDLLSLKGGALSFANPADPVPYVGLDYDGTTDALRVRGNIGTANLNSTYMTFKRTSGFVGIGTTTPTALLQVAGEAKATVFTPTSDRNAKQDFAPVNPAEMLQKVAALPITEWRFKTIAGARHIGPMAQDFRAAFGLGSDDKGIATVDADGVALAAIQGLNQKLEEQKAENAELKARLEKLEQLINQKNGGAK